MQQDDSYLSDNVLRSMTLRDKRTRRGVRREAPLSVGSEAYVEPGYAEVENQLSPQEPAEETESEARARAVRDAVASLSAFERRCYEMAFGPAAMSTREIAHEMEDVVSHMTVKRALDRVKARVLEVLEERGLAPSDD